MDDTGKTVAIPAVFRVFRTGVDAALLAGRTGRWRWPWVLIGTLALPLLVIAAYRQVEPLEARVAARFGPPLEETIVFAAGRPDSFFAFLTFSFVLIATVIAVLYVVHGRSWRAALGPSQRFDWTLFVKAALALFVVNVVSSGVDYVRTPGSWRLLPHGPGHIPWLLLGALVILPQSFAEDFMFKGYLTRVWGAILPYRFAVVPLCAAAFTALHAGNSDVGTDPTFNLISFFLMELLAFAVFLRTGSLGTATGLHWMNNVFVMCLVTTVPGQPSNFALVEFQHPLLASGASKLSDPWELTGLVAGLALLWALLSWPRSPLYLPSATYPAAPPEPAPLTASSEPGPPSPPPQA